jgi:phosphoribosyl 1,2-cyclic phosphodiesterase
MTVKFCPLASGSSGNSAYIGTENTHILIDAGLSSKKLILLLDSIGVEASKLDAIFLTHEHGDHIEGVGVLSRRFNIPIYATDIMWEKIDKKLLVGRISINNRKEVYKQEQIIINDIVLNSFEIPHDSVDAVGYTVNVHNYKICIATDFGHLTDTIIDNLQNSHILLLDCNHDSEMLQNGAYPKHLKDRIAGDFGHLSNVEVANLIVKVNNSALKHVFLGHLSNENNNPILAKETVSNILECNGIDINENLTLHVVVQTIRGELIQLNSK